jgi:hypothetical protein
MTLGKNFTAAILAVAFGALIVPAFAQNGPSDMQGRYDHGMSMGHVDHGMMGGNGMMGGGMMSGGMMNGCSEMMQSMNNGGNGTPNSQWQKHAPRMPDNRG